MVRVWLLSALGVGGAVAALLWLTRPTPPEPRTGREAPEVATLTERNVRDYIAFMPKFLGIIGRAVQSHVQDPGSDKSVQGHVEAACVEHHLTLKDWEKLRRDVEWVVDIIRFEEDKEGRNRRFEEELARKLELLEKSEGEQRKIVQKDVDQLKAIHAAGAPALHPKDRELTRSYWRDLDALVPKTR